MADQKKNKSDTKEIEVLLQISKLISSCNNPETVYQQVFGLLEKMVDFTFAALFIYDDSMQKLSLVASKGHAVDLIQPVSFDMGNGNMDFCSG